MINAIDKYRVDINKTLSANTVEPQGNFFNLLENKLSGIVDQLHQSEKVAIDAASNRADLHTLVTNFAVAEANLKSLVSVLERMVGAIQEITKMQI